MKCLALCVVASVLACGSARGNDNGPQTLGCDYRIQGDEGVGTCLVAGSGTNQGITWVVFEVKGRRYRFESSSPESILRVDRVGKVVKKFQGRNSSAQCRAGGPTADVYTFSNGDRVCLYWR